MGSSIEMSFGNFSMLMKWNTTRSSYGRDGGREPFTPQPFQG